MGRLLAGSLCFCATLVVAAPTWALPVTFTTPNHLPVGDTPRSIAIADFDADGDPDLAVANENVVAGSPPGTVSLFTNQGNGSFSGAGTLTVGHRPRAIVAGMFDTDGDPDLAVANYADDTVSILAGAGVGATFLAPSPFATGDGPRALATGLFNASSDIDLAVANENSDDASVLLGAAGVGFGSQVTYAAGDGPSGVAVGDFDKDLDPDLAVANIGDDNVSILRGGTGGTFETQVDYPSGNGPRGVAVGDYNGDGDLDLAIPNENDDNVAVLVGGAGATFSPPTTFAVGDAPRGIAAADFTRDGDPDLVTVNNQGDGVTVLTGAPGAGFSPAVPLPAGDSPFGVSAQDLNGDGEPDIVVANTGSNNISVLLNRTPPDTSLDSGPQGLTNATTVTFGFGADEPGVSFACRVDGAAFVACTSPLTVSALGDGAHTFEVRATDPAGNQDASPASRAFTVDATAPNATIDSGPPPLTNASSATFVFSANEPAATFECRLDGAAFAPCGSPTTITSVHDGPHSFEVRSTDAAGNVDATAATRAFTVDATAPDTTIDAGPAGAVVGLNPTFRFSSGEPGGFECRVDAAAFVACGSPFAPPTLEPGPHAFEVRARDTAGNLDETPARRSFTALLRITSGVGHGWAAGARFTTVKRLVMTAVPAGAQVQVRCAGRGCPFARKALRRNGRGSASATRLFRRARLRPGATVELRVTARYAIGRVVRFTVRRRLVPRSVILCLRPGAARATRC